MTGTLVIAALLLPTAGCGIVGPSCLDRQERGPVATLNGSVVAGEVVMHRVAYDTRGSHDPPIMPAEMRSAIPAVASHTTRRLGRADEGRGTCGMCWMVSPTG